MIVDTLPLWLVLASTVYCVVVIWTEESPVWRITAIAALVSLSRVSEVENFVRLPALLVCYGFLLYSGFDAFVNWCKRKRSTARRVDG